MSARRHVVTRRLASLVGVIGATLGIAGACSTAHEHAHGGTAHEPMDHATHGAMPAATASASAVDPHAGHPAGDSTRPAGYAPFTLDASKAEGLGLGTVAVEEQAFARTLRTVGIVALDETRTSHVHAKVRGFVESVVVDYVGKRVRRGAPLLTIFSQDVYAAELEFLTILDQTGSPLATGGPFADAERHARHQLLAAARRRLTLWDVPRGEIARLERRREARRTFTLAAPRSGVVISKQALPGTFVDPSVELYVVSDVSRLWVLADVYEADLPWVKLGDAAEITIEGLEGGPRTANVTFLPPTIAEATRTLQVRIDLDNLDGRIRPGAFATVSMSSNLGAGLAVPEDAVIRAGRRAVTFVVAGDRVEPREIALGPLVAGRYRVERGLYAGERVAIGAQFLIDSESRLRATSTAGGHSGHGH